MLYRTKVSRERAELSLRIHGQWNLIFTNIAFSLVGLSLFVNMAMLLARNVDLSHKSCDLFGFIHSFGYNFAAGGILVGLMERTYQYLRPFRYNSYVHGESKIPVVIFVCCTVYSLFLAIIPLTRLGNFYHSQYATCLVSWDKEAATRVTVISNLILLCVMVAFFVIDSWLTWKLYENRKRMKVSLFRHKETAIFMLLTSSVFLICYFPYMVRLSLYTNYSGTLALTSYIYPQQ
jgi:hypothetical protein